MLGQVANLHLADSALHAPAATYGGVEFYEDFPTKAAVLCSRITRNHPLPDGNKRVVYECLREFVARNGYTWSPPPGDDPGGDETVAVMRAVAAGEMSESKLALWIRDRIEQADES